MDASNHPRQVLFTNALDLILVDKSIIHGGALQYA